MEISATDAARNFADLLDGVEHRGERFTIVRRGKVIARLEPAPANTGAAARAVLRRHRPDPRWRDELAATRALATPQDRA